MARAEPAAEITLVFTHLLPQRNAPQVSAHADDDQPLRLHHPVGIWCRICRFLDGDSITCSTTVVPCQSFGVLRLLGKGP